MAKYDENQIQVLEGLEAVRKRPGMYIGSISSKGLHHLVYEIVDNAVDEALAGYCTEINVEILPDNIISVVDNGRGIPVGKHPKMGISTLEVVFTILHAGGKFGGGGYKVSGGLHGVGASVVNALSESLYVEACDGDGVYAASFSRGKTIEHAHKISDGTKTGTKVVFKPDSQIFETTVFDKEVLVQRLREMAFLNKGLKITLWDKREEDSKPMIFHYEGGIKEFVSFLDKGKEVLNPDVEYFETEENDIQVEVALQYTTSYSETILSFVNNIPTGEGGTHVDGFKRGLTKAFNDYARRFKILKDKDQNFQGEDIREGIYAVVSVRVLEPQFEGQTKTKLGNSEVTGVVSSIVNQKMAQYLEENPSVAKVIIDKTITSQRAREAARKARDNIKRKSVLESSTLPGKLADCSSKEAEKCEIYIVEGDSAGGSAKQGRDRRFQAILPLWGKMLNVEKARADKVINNEKLSPVIIALGAGIDPDFNMEKLRYHKVILMADADVDGAHIRTLLLTFFFRHMRPLIENGCVYIAQPPLYRIAKGDDKNKGKSSKKKENSKSKKDFEDIYCYDDKALDVELKKLENEGIKLDQLTIQRYKGLGEMDGEQLWETTMNPEKRILKRVTMEDAVSADQTFTVLMGDDVEPRREFIEENARNVTNLDI